MTLTDIERIGAFEAAERTFQMDEEAFRAFYELTARSLWAYLARATGDPRLADDLLQEAYYRFLRARVTFESDEHRRHYLFRIAINLVHDHRRRPTAERSLDAVPAAADAAHGRLDDRSAARIDVARAMGRLKPRDRSMLWLAYAQGWSHEEIARALGLRTASLKCLLYRARRRLAALLGAPDGPRPKDTKGEHREP
jgi:RNA polymerase sigma-70 factor (ECF subfamily)